MYTPIKKATYKVSMIPNSRPLPDIKEITHTGLFGGIKGHYTLRELIGVINSIEKKATPKETKEAKKDFHFLKGIYRKGYSGRDCEEFSNLLFFDIDVNPSKKENIILNKNALNRELVYESLKKIALFVASSNSGEGMFGAFYVKGLNLLTPDDKDEHRDAGVAITDYISTYLLAETQLVVEFDISQNKFRQPRFLAHQPEPCVLNPDYKVFSYKRVDSFVRLTSGRDKLRPVNHNDNFDGGIEAQFNNKERVDDIMRAHPELWTDLGNDKWKWNQSSSPTSGIYKPDLNIYLNWSESFGSTNSATRAFRMYMICSGFNYEEMMIHCFNHGYRQPEYKKDELQMLINKASSNEEKATVGIKLRNLTPQQRSSVKFLDPDIIDYTYDKPLKTVFDEVLILPENERYIKSLVPSIFDLADKHGKILINSETGSGKTRSLIENLPKGKRIIFIVPLVMLAQQVYPIAINDNIDVALLSGTPDNKDVVKAKTCQFVIATQPNAASIMRVSHTFDYIIIDEAHKNISAIGWQNSDLRKLEASKKLQINAKTIGITGTATNAFRFMDLGYKTVDIQSSHSPIEVTQRIDNRLIATKIIKQFLDNYRKPEERVIFRINSTDTAHNIKRIIKEPVLTLDRDSKETTEWKEIVENQTVSENYKIIICTSVMDEGISLYDNIDHLVFIENSRDMLPESVKQFFARVRNANDRTNFVHYRLSPSNTIYLDSYDDEISKLKDLKLLDSQKKYRSVKLLEKYFDEEGDILYPMVVNDQMKNLYSSFSIEEYIIFCRINFKMNITLDTEYEPLDIAEEVESSKDKHENCTNEWIYNKDEIFVVLRDDKPSKKTQDLAKKALRGSPISMYDVSPETIASVHNYYSYYSSLLEVYTDSDYNDSSFYDSEGVLMSVANIKRKQSFIDHEINYREGDNAIQRALTVAIELLKSKDNVSRDEVQTILNKELPRGRVWGASFIDFVCEKADCRYDERRRKFKAGGNLRKYYQTLVPIEYSKIVEELNGFLIDDDHRVSYEHSKLEKGRLLVSPWTKKTITEKKLNGIK